MKLNYIDHEKTPVSVMFVADDIELICDFLKLNQKSIDDHSRHYALQEIANTFHEINHELIGAKS